MLNLASRWLTWRPRRPTKIFVVATLLSGIVTGAATTIQTTEAGFKDVTVNASNAFQSGQVALSDDDSGSAAFSTGAPRNDGSLALGATLTRCIAVTYTGTNYSRSFYDNFGSQDATWATWTSAAAVTGGQAQITLTAGGNQYDYVTTTSGYDFRNGSATIEPTTQPNTGSGTTEMLFTAQPASTGNYNQLSLLKANNRLRARNRIAGNSGTDVTIVWDGVAMKYWRISNNNTNVFWQYSADKYTWTTLRTDTVPYAMTTMYFRMEAGHYGTEPSPGIATFDNLAFEGYGGVRMYGTSTGSLAPYIDLTIERGTGTTFPSCTGFTGGTTVYSGTLSAFTAAMTDYASGLGGWMPSSPPETRSYRITTTVQNNASAAGLTASGTFTWESQSGP